MFPLDKILSAPVIMALADGIYDAAEKSIMNSTGILLFNNLFARILPSFIGRDSAMITSSLLFTLYNRVKKLAIVKLFESVSIFEILRKYSLPFSNILLFTLLS